MWKQTLALGHRDYYHAEQIYVLVKVLFLISHEAISCVKIPDNAKPCAPLGLKRAPLEDLFHRC
jgi:hypothetical protein